MGGDPKCHNRITLCLSWCIQVLLQCKLFSMPSPYTDPKAAQLNWEDFAQEHGLHRVKCSHSRWIPQSPLLNAQPLTHACARARTHLQRMRTSTQQCGKPHARSSFPQEARGTYATETFSREAPTENPLAAKDKPHHSLCCELAVSGLMFNNPTRTETSQTPPLPGTISFKNSAYQAANIRNINRDLVPSTTQRGPSTGHSFSCDVAKSRQASATESIIIPHRGCASKRGRRVAAVKIY